MELKMKTTHIDKPKRHERDKMKKSARENKGMEEVVRHISTLLIPIMLTLVMMGCGQAGGDNTSLTPSNDHGDHKHIGGNISGLSGLLVLQNKGEDTLETASIDGNNLKTVFIHKYTHETTSNGVFTFSDAFEDGADYNISVLIQPNEQACTVSNGIGTVSGLDVTDVQIECTYDFARVSKSSDGVEGFEDSYTPNLSDDGKYIVFDSESSNLVTDDFNYTTDVFVRDRETGETRRVSISTDGYEGNSDSYSADISGDGRHIAFSSFASNLVADDNNNKSDIFVHDLETGETTIVSISADGVYGNGTSSNPSISEHGRYVAFESTSSNIASSRTSRQNIYVHDRETGETVHASMATDGTLGNKNSSQPAISNNGKYVAFESDARNLVAGDNNYSRDVFVHDLTTGETKRVSVASDGTQADSLSAGSTLSGDGRYIAFVSYASNLVSDDLNYSSDIFVHDLSTGETRRVSLSSDGIEADFYSYSSSISSDGRYVAFESESANLVPDDFNYISDIFVHDRDTGETTRMSVASDGTEANDYNYAPAISGNGQYVAFESEASNLVPDDFNNRIDIFVAPVRPIRIDQ
jgi:hypothetical protein